MAKKSAAQGESPFEGDREIEIEPAKLPEVSDPKPPKKKKQKGKGSDRGVETMFRTSYRTHLALSSLADAKANIMISINGIIISILLATVYPSVTQSRWLIIPSTILLLSSLDFSPAPGHSQYRDAGRREGEQGEHPLLWNLREHDRRGFHIRYVGVDGEPEADLHQHDA